MKNSKYGYTLMEIMIVIIVIGVLSSLALPRLGVVIERSRSAEGAQILSVLLAAQKRFALENGGAYQVGTAGGGTSELGPNDLDVSIPASVNFSAYFIYNNAAEVAKVQRGAPFPNDYYMSIDEDGIITCGDSGSGICLQMGYH